MNCARKNTASTAPTAANNTGSSTCNMRGICVLTSHMLRKMLSNRQKTYSSTPGGLMCQACVSCPCPMNAKVRVMPSTGHLYPVASWKIQTVCRGILNPPRCAVVSRPSVVRKNDASTGSKANRKNMSEMNRSERRTCGGDETARVMNGKTGTVR